MKSAKTTGFGLAAAIAVVTDALSDGLTFAEDWKDLVVGVCLALLGFLARDDNVSSEGDVAPKNRKPLENQENDS